VTGRGLRALLLRSAAAGAALLLMAAAASAQAAAEGKWWKRPRIASELQLSADQVDQLEKIFARVKPKLIDLRADLEKKQFDYEQSMQAESTDRKTIEAKIEAREESRARLQKELALMELDMKQVLKPDQRERLMRLKEEAKQRLQERRRRLRDGDSEDRPARQGKAKPGGGAR
jgi:Spy/CpxP family protein refolding chaperone